MGGRLKTISLQSSGRGKETVSDRAVRSTRVGFLLTHLALSTAGILMGRATILGSLFPFQSAYLVAVSVVFPRSTFWVLASILVGYFSISNPLETVALGLALLLTTGIKMVFLPAEERLRPMGVGFLSSGATLMARGTALLLGGPDLYGVTLLAFEVILSFLLAVLVHRALGMIMERSSLAVEDMIPPVILLASALSGIHGLRTGPLAWENVVGGLLVMLVALRGGCSLGAAAGVTVGTILTLRDPLSSFVLGVYPFGGFLAGTLKDFGKTGVAAGWVLARVVLSVSLFSVNEVTVYLVESMVSCVLLTLVPNRLLDWVIPFPQETTENSRNRPYEPGPETQMLSRRLREFGRVFGELSRTFEQISSGEEKSGTDEFSLSNLFKRIADQLCGACPRHKRCWGKDFYQTYRALFDLLGLAENRKPLTPGDVPDTIRKRCFRVEALVSTVNHLFELYQLNYNWKKRMAESREIVANQLTGISQIMNNLAVELSGEDPEGGGFKAAFRRTRPMEYEVGLARQSKKSSSVSGDTYLAKRLSDGKLILVLSDGMGSGSRAAMESRATVSLLEHLLETGFSKDVAVRTVNSILLLRSPDEIFATVDLSIIDLVRRTGEFIKIGAAPSFLIRDDEIMVIKSASLPIGIVNHIEIKTTRKMLRPGDILVMVTDGVLDSRKDLTYKEEWILGFLRDLRYWGPQQIAESLLEKALAQAAELADDMTILVTRFGYD